jgi:hypothetical protein
VPADLSALPKSARSPLGTPRPTLTPPLSTRPLRPTLHPMGASNSSDRVPPFRTLFQNDLKQRSFRRRASTKRAGERAPILAPHLAPKRRRTWSRPAGTFRESRRFQSLNYSSLP